MPSSVAAGEHEKFAKLCVAFPNAVSKGFVDLAIAAQHSQRAGIWREQGLREAN